MRRVTLAALAAVLLLPAPAARALPGCAEADVPGGDWPSYGHDLANTRTQPREHAITAADVPLLTSAWTFGSAANGGAGDFTGTPTVADGCMYVATNRGWVFAVNADTGKLAWKRQVPYGGGVNSSVTVGRRALAARRAKYKRRRHRHRHRRRGHRRPRQAATAGTLFVEVTRTQKAQGCPAGDPCNGPYVVALDQATGNVVWATAAIDTQPGADVYGSPVFFDGMLLVGVSGGAAELSDEADRYAFQGSMSFIDADTGAVLHKTWTIHPPGQPQDDFAGAGIWSSPAVDREAKVAYAGTGNPFRPQVEHPHANAIVKFDLDRASPHFGEIIAHYKGVADEYIEAYSKLPCQDFPGNSPPYYPQGIGSCGDIDLDFGASPNLWTDASGRKLVGEGQKAGVYHAVDAGTMAPVWSQVVGTPGALGGIVGSTAVAGGMVYGPVTIPGYLWALSSDSGDWRWLAAVADGAHYGPPVSVANGVAYTVDFTGNLDAFDTRLGTQILKRPLVLGGGGPLPVSWGGVSIARNTVYAAVGTLGASNAFVVAFRPGGPADVVADAGQTDLGGGGGGGGGGLPAGPSILAAPGAASTGYATPVVVAQPGGKLSFVNLDVVQHDVVAEAKGPDGAPLFRTPLVGTGESAPVEGLDRVQSGQSYAFYCSVHPGMRGTLSVR